MQKVKVKFDLEGNPVVSETLWAEKVGDNIYRLLNIPYHAKGFAESDIIRCIERDEWLVVIGLEKDSGNGTIRIFFTVDSKEPKAEVILKELNSVGCSYERASSRLVALTVPATLEIPFSQLVNFINSIDENIIIGWEVAKLPYNAKV